MPDHKGVDIAEDRVAALGRRAQAIDVVEQPLDFGAREIGRQRQADLVAEAILPALFGELVDDLVGASILPDDRVVVGLAGVLIQTTVVSRWLVTPTAAISLGSMLPLLSAPLITLWVRSQISSGLCSTQPGLG
jgi:hypothetical protein